MIGEQSSVEMSKIALHWKECFLGCEQVNVELDSLIKQLIDNRNQECKGYCDNYKMLEIAMVAVIDTSPAAKGGLFYDCIQG